MDCTESGVSEGVSAVLSVRKRIGGYNLARTRWRDVIHGLSAGFGTAGRSAVAVALRGRAGKRPVNDVLAGRDVLE